LSCPSSNRSCRARPKNSSRSASSKPLIQACIFSNTYLLSERFRCFASAVSLFSAFPSVLRFITAVVLLSDLFFPEENLYHLRSLQPPLLPGFFTHFIPHYRRGERRFGTWQGRLPQELRLAGITTVEEANRFLRERFIPEMNRKFSVPAAAPGHAFVPLRGQDLDRIFSVQTERVVAQDNTVRAGNRVWQLEPISFRGSLAGCRVMICEHLDGRLSILYGPHRVGYFRPDGTTLDSSKRRRGQKPIPPSPISAPGSALGLLPSSALSSAQVAPSLLKAGTRGQISLACTAPSRAGEPPRSARHEL